MIPSQFAHIEANDTLPKLLRYNARNHGGDIVLREKEHGLWRTFTWADYHERAKLWGIALHKLGVGPGDAVAIIGDSRPDWVAAAVGTHAAKGLSLGIYQDALDSEVGYLLNFAQAKAVIAENEEQVDKILRAAAGGSSLRAIIYCDPRGMRKYADLRLMSRDALLEDARKVAASEPGLWDALVDETSGSDVAVLCSTSGTTTNPKLVSISSGRFLRHAATYCSLVDLGPDDEYVSILPMAWVVEQFQALYQPMVCRHKLNFVELPATVMTDLREIAPTFMLLAPRSWEQIAANVRAQMMDASALKQKVFGLGLSLGCGRWSEAAEAEWRRRWCCVRCAIGSASRACASPLPAARRWVPIHSSSSWRWASRCCRSTARPSSAASTACSSSARWTSTPSARA